MITAMSLTFLIFGKWVSCELVFLFYFECRVCLGLCFHAPAREQPVFRTKDLEGSA